MSPFFKEYNKVESPTTTTKKMVFSFSLWFQFIQQIEHLPWIYFVQKFCDNSIGRPSSTHCIKETKILC